jgi:hypothetical protein
MRRRLVVVSSLVGAALAVAALLAAPARSVGQDACAQPRLLTPVGGTLPRTGFGLVVSDPRPDAALAVGLLRGRRRTPLVASPLGPGLFRLSEVVRPGTYRLDGLAAPSDVVVSARATQPAPAAAPAVRAARRVASTAMGSGRTRTEILVDLSFPVPQGAIVARAHWNDADAVAMWTSVAAGQASFAMPLEPPCVPRGWQPPPDGVLSMRVSFVDALGQASPLSGAVNVE